MNSTFWLLIAAAPLAAPSLDATAEELTREQIPAAIQERLGLPDEPSTAANTYYFQALSDALYAHDLTHQTPLQSDGVLVESGRCAGQRCSIQALNRAVDSRLPRVQNIRIAGAQSGNHSGGIITLQWDMPATPAAAAHPPPAYYEVQVIGGGQFRLYEVRGSESHGTPQRNRGHRHETITGGGADGTHAGSAGAEPTGGTAQQAHRFHGERRRPKQSLLITDLPAGDYHFRVRPVYRQTSEKKQPGLASATRSGNNNSDGTNNSDSTLFIAAAESETFGSFGEPTVGSVTFVSKALQNCVYAAVNNNLSAPVSSVTSLTCTSKGVTSLEGLEQFTALSYLNLNSNPILDLTPLSGLTGLQSLYVGNSSISTLSPLSQLTNLRYLHFYNTSVQSLVPLANLSALTHLYGNNNPISYIPDLSATALRYITLSNNPINDISGLRHVRTLEQLYLYGTNLGDLKPILDNASDYSALYQVDLRVTADALCVQLDELTTLLNNNDPQNASLLRPLQCSDIAIPANLGSSANPAVGNAYTLSWQNGGIPTSSYRFDLEEQTELRAPQTLNPGSQTSFSFISQPLKAPGSYVYRVRTCIVGVNSEDCGGWSVAMEQIVLANPDRPAADALNDIQDINLKSCVSQNIATGMTAGELTYLNCASRFIVSLAGLDSFPSISTLILNNNPLSDLSALNNLSALNQLQLYGCSITTAELPDFSTPLASQSFLQLNLGNNQLTDASALSALNNASWLYLQNNSLSDIAFANNLTVSVLSAWNNQITAIPDLSNTSVSDLSLENNQITNIDALPSASALTSLRLNNNLLISADTSKIGLLANLQYLHLENTGINNISFVTALNALDTLYLNNNTLTNLTPLADKSTLRVLHIDGTFLTDFRHINNICPLSGSCSLTTVSALNTPINNLGSMDRLATLTSIKISGGNLSATTSLDPLNQLSNLYTLTLGDNGITHIQSLIDLSTAPTSALTVADLSDEVTARCQQLDTLSAELNSGLHRPPQCSFEIPEAFNVARDTTTGFYYLSWERPPVAWGDVKYHLQSRELGGNGSDLVIVDEDGQTSHVATALSANKLHQFRLRACRQSADTALFSANPCVGGWSEWQTFTDGLTAVTHIDLAWNDINNGLFTLRWEYPDLYFNEFTPDTFKVFNLASPATPLATIAAGSVNQRWSSGTLSDNHASSIYIIKACAVDNTIEACGPERTITVVRPPSTADSPAPTGFQATYSNTGTPFKTITLNWQAASDSEVDYYTITEQNSGDTMVGYIEHDAAFMVGGNTMQLPLRRPGGLYDFKVQACYRDRANGDSCSTEATTPTLSIPVTTLGYTAPDGLCWRDESSPDGTPRMSLEWQYTANPQPSYFKGVHTDNCMNCGGGSTRSHNFIVDAVSSGTTYSAVTDEAGQPLKRGIWELYVCSSGDFCQSVATISHDAATSPDGPACSTTFEPTPDSPQGGPDSLAPGHWWNSQYDGQGWYFYWANRLQLDDTHPEYGNTYDLVAIWGTYRLFDGHWQPVWLYSKLKADSSDDSQYRGDLFYPRANGSVNHQHVGHVELTFAPSSTTNATIRVRSSKEGGLSTLDFIDPGQPHHNGYFVLELSNISETLLSSPQFSQINTADHLSGLWSPCTGGDCMGSTPLLLNIISGEFDGNSVLFYDTNGEPIWANASNCYINSSAATCQPSDPGYPGYLLQAGRIYTVANGNNPFYTTPEAFSVEQNKLIAKDIVGGSNSTLQRSFGTGVTDQKTGSINAYDINFIFPGNGRVARLNVNSPIEKRANLHDIRFRTNGDPTLSNCILDQGPCDLDFTWYTDGAYPELEPRYIRTDLNDPNLADRDRPMLAETLPFDADLCGQGAAAPAIGSTGSPLYSVEHYECSLSLDGQYRFYLFNHRTANNETHSAPIAVSKVLRVNATEDTAASALPAGSAPAAPDPLNPAHGLDSAAINASAMVGTTSGGFAVDASGAATYNLPIYTVPATADVAPQVSLSYNSQSASGIAGRGWSIGGLSMISRCGNNYELDGFLREVQLDAEDRFCLDGQRLVQVNGSQSQPYGSNGAEYFTELDTFSRIRSYGNTGDGPRYFKVERKDGSVSYYGDWCYAGSNESAACPSGTTSGDSLIQFGGSGPAYAWAHDYMRDSADNYIRYQWLAQPGGGIELLVDEIQYTGHHSNTTGEAHAPFATIKFNYSALPQSQQRTTYLAGMKILTTRHLNNIESQSGGDILRRYKLTYAAASTVSPEVRMLQSIHECTVASGSELCRAPVEFDWNQGENFITAASCDPDTPHCFDWDAGGVRDTEIGNAPLDFDGNGTQDSLFLINNHTCPSNPAQGVTPDPADYLELDVITYNAGAAANHYQTKYENVGQLPCHVRYFGSGIDSPFEPHWLISDYDADSFQDIVYIDWDNKIKALRATHVSNQPRFASATVIGDVIPNPSGGFDYRQVKTLRQSDINGDGRSDLIYTYGNAAIYINIHSGNATTPYGTPIRVLNTNNTPQDPLRELGITFTAPTVNTGDVFQQPIPRFNQNTRVFDANGDGAADLLINIYSQLCTPIPGDDCDFDNNEECSPADPDCEIQGAPPGNQLNTTNRKRFSVWYVLIANPLGHTDPADPSNDVPYFDTTQTRPFFWQFCDPEFPDCATITGANGAAGPVTGLRYFELVDINSDSLADIVYRNGADTSHQWQALLNTGTDFDFAAPISLDLLAGVDASDKPLAKYLQYLDYDGNGYTDILYTGFADGDCGGSDYFGVNCSTWKVILNNGGHFASSAIVAAVAGNMEHASAPDSSDFRDVNGDGLLDHLYFDRQTAISPDDPGLEHVYVALGRLRETTGPTAPLTSAKPVYQMTGFTTGITGAAQQTTAIEYGLMTDRQVYRRANNARDTQFGDSVIYDLIPSGYLVKTVSSQYAHHQRTGNTTSATISATNTPVSTRYFYTGAKIQAGGRGFLGFASMSTYDEQNHTLSITQYRQDFPYIGQMYRSTSWYVPAAASLPWDSNPPVMPCSGAACAMALPNIVNDQSCTDVSIDDIDTTAYYLLNNAETHWRSYFTRTGVTFTYAGEQRQCTFTPQSGSAGQIGSSSALISSVRTVNNYNANIYGNLPSATVTTYQGDLNSNQFSEVATTNTYTNSVSRWHLGRLQTSSATHRRWDANNTPLPGITRNSEFAYDPVTGILTDEWVEKDTGDEVHTHYTLDHFGNTTATTVTYQEDYGNGATEKARGTRVAYDSLGRFVNRQYDADDQLISEVLSRNRYGSATQVQDVQGQVATTEYGPMGRAYFQKSATGTFSIMTYHAGATQPNAGTVCPAATMYHTYSRSPYAGGSQAVAPAVYTCYDALDREIRSRSQNLEAGQWIVTDTVYDPSNRTLAVSRPLAGAASGSNTSHWALSYYDDLGRVWLLRNPDGTTQQTSYSGRSTTIVNERGQTRTEAVNPAGETVLILDDLTGTVQHEYDVVGNLTATDGPMAGAVDRTTMAYNRRGHKTSMSDPDKGYWEYRYNSLGELLCQIDANGDAVRQEYDHFGRLVKRSDYRAANFNHSDCSGIVEAQAQHATWVYITNPATDGYGQLLRSQQLGFDQDAQGTVSVHQEVFTYDAFGRVARVDTTIDGATFTRRNTYDEVGRPFQHFDAHRNPHSPLGRRYHYNPRGQVYAVSEAATDSGVAPAQNCQSGSFYQCIVSRDTWGNITGEYNGAGDFTYRRFDDNTGRAEYQQTSDNTLAVTHAASYRFDGLGNLTARAMQWPDGAGGFNGVQETFVYDTLNRLVEHREAGGPLGTLDIDPANGYPFPADQPVKAHYRYDGQYSASDNPMAPPAGPGNMTYKGGLELYYGSHPDCTTPAGPHAVCGTQPSGSTSLQTTYSYDLNGNNLSGDGRTINYTVFNKPWQIQSTNGTTRFWYSADRNRFKREDVGERYEYYIGNVEVLKENGQTVYRRSIANTIVRFEPNVDLDIANSPRSHTITDHLGSTVAVHTPDPTAPWQYQTFEPFGKLLRQSNLGSFLSDIRHWTDRGFTGHEDIAGAGIIHMNGRIYDPALGRFLQADPFVQEPDYSQSLNRYSYVLNNPLSYTDPSGYFTRFLAQVWRPLANIVGCAAGPVACAATVTATSLVAGESLLKSLRNGVIAGIQAYAFNAIGNVPLDSVENVIGVAIFHGAISGLGAGFQGGNAGSAFLAGFLTKGVTVATAGYIQSIDSLVIESIIYGTIGGTISEVTGGNFANGATTAAIGYIYNSRGLSRGRATPAKSSKQPNLVLTPAEEALVLREANNLYPETHPTESFIEIDKKGNATTVSDTGCTNSRCLTTRGARIVLHSHVNRPGLNNQLSREFPGPGDHLLANDGTINVYKSPTGAVRAIERINGQLRLRTLSGGASRLNSRIENVFNTKQGLTEREIGIEVRNLSRGRRR